MRTALLGALLLLAGAVGLITGVLPFAEFETLVGRVAPILLFVAAVTVVTELSAEAGLFRALAERTVRWGRGRALVLWLLVVALAVVCTIFLSLDTTAVLLTPVVVALARQAKLPPLSFALTTVWLANTASLLLPVSNLTNLLAAGRIGGVGEVVALTALPAAACILVPCILLAIVFRRELRATYVPSAFSTPGDRTLLIVSAVVVGALVIGLVSGAPVWIPASVAALVLLIVFAVRRREVVRLALVPWPLLLFAAGLFLAAEAAQAAGLGALLAPIASGGTDAASLARLAASGAVGANAIDNLPAYLAFEPQAEDSPVRLVALLIGVNAGPLITPWASLATLLWHRGLAAEGVRLSWRRYMLLGCIAAPLTVAAGVGALVLAR